MLTVIEENSYMKLLYDKPEIEGESTFFKRIAHKFKVRLYTKSVILPAVKRMRNESPTFFQMCEFGDFIRLLEKVMFYNNNIRKANDLSPLKKVHLMSDNNIDGSGDSKNIIMDLEQDNVTVTFVMTRKYNSDATECDEYIEESVHFNTVKRLCIRFTIVNREAEFESIHDWNMAKNINSILQNAMADLFYEYYLKM